MKLAKAIQIGQLNLKQTGKAMPPDCHDAVQLLVEASKYLLHIRAFSLQHHAALLPGETPDLEAPVPDEKPQRP